MPYIFIECFGRSNAWHCVVNSEEAFISMKKLHKYFVITIFAVSMLFSGTALAALPGEAGAIETAKANAATLLAKGKYSDAYDAYMRLLREDPEDDAVNLGLARAATLYGRHNQAIMAYERLVEKYPRETALYKEMANSFMALGDRVSAERALARLRLLDTNVTQEDMEKALNRMDEQYSLLLVRGSLRAGLMYDSNANQGPSSNRVSLGNWNLTLVDAREVESGAAYFGGNVDIARRFARDSQWWVVGDVQAQIRGNFNNDLAAQNSRTSLWARAAAGLRHLSSSTLVDVRMKAEMFDYELFQHVSAIGPEATFLWAVTPSFHLITRGNVEYREYSRAPERKGYTYAAGEYARLFFGKDNHSLLFGARYIGSSPEKRDYRYDSWEGMARLSFNLPYGFEVSPFMVYAEEFYKGPATALESEKREDEIWRFGSSIVYHMDKNWDIEFMYQYANRNSNSAIYEYDQHLTSIGIAWNF